MQYLGTDDAGTNSFSLQDFEPSFGSKMNAAVRESWLESYGPVAKDWWNSSAGGDGTKRLSAAEAQDYAKANGGGAKLGITPKDGQYTAEQWGTIVSRQRELAAVKDVRERTPWDMGSVVRGGAMFGAGIVDPINVATAFVPWTRMVGVARGLHAAAMAESALTRAGARAGLGAIDGGISTAVLEPAYAYARSELGDDYGALDSMANIGFGTAFGGGLHVLGGAAGDAFKSWRAGRAAPAVPAPEITPELKTAAKVMTPEERVQAGIAPEAAHAGMPEIVEPHVREQPPAPEVAPTIEIHRGLKEKYDPTTKRATYFFSTDKAVAEGYSGPNGETITAKVPADGVLDTSNPAHVDRLKPEMVKILEAAGWGENAGAQADKILGKIAESKGNNWHLMENPEVQVAARNAGFDGMIVKEDGVRNVGMFKDPVATDNTAATRAASVAPETREAALRASVAQAVDGRSVDVEPIIGMDESRQSHTMDDVTAAADRNFEPENMALADIEAAAAVQARVDAAPKWDGVKDAEAALADADALLADTVKAGDQAFKYSREAIGPEVAEGDSGNVVAYYGNGAESFINADKNTDGSFQITESGLQEGLRGQGLGLGMYRALLSAVFERGAKTLQSDGSVSAAAQRIYAKLENAGYIVEKNPAAVIDPETKALETSDGSPVFTVSAGTSEPITYSRGVPPEQAPAFLTESLRQSFGNSTERLLDEGRIKLVATPEEIPGGPHPGDVKAATAPDGTVYVVASNVSELEARGLVLHEVGVHVGMERMLGTDVFQSVLGELDDAISRGESWANAARANVPSDTPAGLVREEQLAYLVEKSPELPIVQRIIAAVRAWAYRTFDLARERMTLTEADFRAMAVSALHHAARGEQGGVLAGAYARAGGAADQFRAFLSANRSYVEDGLRRRLLAQSDDFVIREVPLDSVRLLQSGEDYLNDSSRYTAEQIRRGTAVERRPEDVFPVLLSKDGALLDGHHRHAAATINGEGTILALVPVQPGRGRVLNLDEFGGSADGGARYSRGETPDPSTTKDELKPYDDAVKRAKGYAGVLRAAADKLENDADATAAMRAAMPDISPVEIDELLGRLRSQVNGLRGMARTARTAVTADDSAALLQTDAMKAADTLANNIMQAAVIEKRNAALNIAARLKATTYLNQFRGSGLDFEGFRGLLVGTERKRAGGRISVDTEQKNFRGEWLGGMIADLEKQDLMRAFASGEFDRDAYRALYNLARDGAGNEKLPKEAVAIAQIVNKYQTDARNTRNRFGAWIRDLQGYITRQSHDMLKIRDVGEQKYKADVLPLLDLERSMRDFDGSADDFLTRVYDDFAAGSHLKTPAGENDMAAFGRGSSLARRESASRVLYFKDGDAAYQYNAKFGQGGLAESVLGGLDSAAKSAGLLKLLGTNPEATATRLFDEYADSLRGDPKRRAAFLSHRKELENLLSHVDGSANIPGNVTAARISSFFRAWQTMSKLGGMLISSVTDLTNYAAELRFGQDKNLLTGTLEGMGALTRGRSSGEKRAVLNSLGVFHESTLGAVFSRFDSPDQLGGKTSWAMQQFFKLTGINWWTESLRDGYALAHTSYMSAQASKSFDKLPTALRDMMGLYNIDAGKWDVLRLANTQQADGRMYITPEGLRTVPRAALANYITQVGRTANDAAIANLQDDLASALRTMTIDRMHHAVIEPSARTRAFMLRGTQPGTVPGEFLRFVTQFKSFPVALIQMTLGREIYGRGYDTLGDYVKRGKGDMLGLASFIALSTAMGYAAMSAKDLLRGKNPRPVDDARTWAAAMVQGGGLGLYGDFLFGKYNRMGGSLTGSLAGPVANLADTAADLWTRIRTGDDFGAVAFNAALQNTPFANLFYTRVALDYLVLYQMQEAMNPGFLRRMERRAERENGQQFYLPPSQVVR